VIGCGSSLGPRAKGYSVNPGLVFPEAWGIAVAAIDDRGEPIRQPKLAAVLRAASTNRGGDLSNCLVEHARRRPYLSNALSERLALVELNAMTDLLRTRASSATLRSTLLRSIGDDLRQDSKAR